MIINIIEARVRLKFASANIHSVKSPALVMEEEEDEEEVSQRQYKGLNVLVG